MINASLDGYFAHHGVSRGVGLAFRPWIGLEMVESTDMVACTASYVVHPPHDSPVTIQLQYGTHTAFFCIAENNTHQSNRSCFLFTLFPLSVPCLPQRVQQRIASEGALMRTPADPYAWPFSLSGI